MGVGIFLKGGSIFERVRYVCVCVIASRFMAIYGSPKVPITFIGRSNCLLKMCGLIHILILNVDLMVICLNCPPDHHICIGRFKFMDNSPTLIEL